MNALPTVGTSGGGQVRARDRVLFSVVIPAYNAEAYIGAQLAALEDQIDGQPYEVIVVDNLSTDRTVAIAEQHALRLDLRVVTASKLQSAPHARNVGVKEARGEVIVFVDADDVADQSLLAAYRQGARQHSIMGGMCEETRLNDPERVSWQPAMTSNGLPVFLGKLPHFAMGNAAIHRSVFDEVGAFEETLTYGGEEQVFCACALQAGYTIGWIPDAVVYVRHRETLRDLARQWFNWGRSTTLVYVRYRDSFGFPRTSVRRTLELAWAVIPHFVDLALGARRRGRWVRLSSFLAGEAIESVRRGVWHL